MYKKALRKDYKQKRRALSDSLIEEASLSIANKLLEMPIWHFFYYHIFLFVYSFLDFGVLKKPEPQNMLNFFRNFNLRMYIKIMLI